MITTSPPTPDTFPGVKLVPIVKRWGLVALGMVCGLTIKQQGGVDAQVLDLLKTYGLPTVLLLLSGAKLTQWVERVASWGAPKVSEFVEHFGAIALSVTETKAQGKATAKFLDEANEQAQAERADLADAVRALGDQSKRRHDDLKAELRQIQALAAKALAHLERFEAQSIVPKGEAT